MNTEGGGKPITDYSHRHIDNNRTGGHSNPSKITPEKKKAGTLLFTVLAVFTTITVLACLLLDSNQKRKEKDKETIDAQATVDRSDAITEATLRVFRPFSEKQESTQFMSKGRQMALKSPFSVLMKDGDEIVVMRPFQRYNWKLEDDLALIAVYSTTEFNNERKPYIYFYVSPKIMGDDGRDYFQDIFTGEWQAIVPLHYPQTPTPMTDYDERLHPPRGFNPRIIISARPQSYVPAGTADYRFAAMQLSKKIRQRDALARQNGLPARRFGLQRSVI
ncbi:MAG: hypothetical protein WC717_04610 [Candidatus Micrarchaeia archaeon]